MNSSTVCIRRDLGNRCPRPPGQPIHECVDGILLSSSRASCRWFPLRHSIWIVSLVAVVLPANAQCIFSGTAAGALYGRPRSTRRRRSGSSRATSRCAHFSKKRMFSGMGFLLCFCRLVLRTSGSNLRLLHRCPDSIRSLTAGAGALLRGGQRPAEHSSLPPHQDPCAGFSLKAYARPARQFAISLKLVHRRVIVDM